jgi:hypothetical protein
MTKPPIEQLLGIDDRDPGCEGAFAVLDEYAEAVHRGEAIGPQYAEFVTHIRNCAACREDAEGLVAALALMDPPPPAR